MRHCVGQQRLSNGPFEKEVAGPYYAHSREAGIVSSIGQVTGYQLHSERYVAEVGQTNRWCRR